MKMQNTSDIIEVFLKDLIQQQNGELELKRNELAGHFNCAPSQINYVLATRFTVNRGYVVTSRKGGGGYIRITRTKYDSKAAVLMHVVNSIGNEIDEASCQAHIYNLNYQKILSPEISKLMLAATGDRSLKEIPTQFRDRARASIFKQMLLSNQ